MRRYFEVKSTGERLSLRATTDERGTIIDVECLNVGGRSGNPNPAVSACEVLTQLFQVGLPIEALALAAAPVNLTGAIVAALMRVSQEERALCR